MKQTIPFERGLSLALAETDFPQLGRRHRGKVRDSYVKDGRRTIIATDRVSAFDVPLGTVPFKGQVLNGIAAHWFRLSGDLVPNHLIAVPDPAVSVVEECTVFPVEMVVRGYLTGTSATSIWTHYAQGARSYCGHRLPEGMRQHERLPQALVTPTTKAPQGEHDALTSRDELIGAGAVSAEEFDRAAEMCLLLFALGQKVAAERGLLLVDTKYELGRRADGTIIVVDEIHTPDSSRYWYSDGYEQALAEGRDPRPLDKDFIRRHLQGMGYRGEGTPPPLSDEVRIEAAARYVELYEQVTGARFLPDLSPPLVRIARNLGLS